MIDAHLLARVYPLDDEPVLPCSFRARTYRYPPELVIPLTVSRETTPEG